MVIMRCPILFKLLPVTLHAIQETQSPASMLLQRHMMGGAGWHHVYSNDVKPVRLD